MIDIIDQADGYVFNGAQQGHSAERAQLAGKALAGSGLQIDHRQARGRGTAFNPAARFEVEHRERFDDGWDLDETLKPLKTEILSERARTIITRNTSPDISFDRTINPYRGCEHGCVYCFARPMHAYTGLSAGMDFEQKIFVKERAAQLLEKELSKPGYKPKSIAIGASTDPYQPIERSQKIMRELLQVASDFNQPVAIVTKSALITRDIDLLAPMAERGIVKVAISLTTLDHKLSRLMEPRASAPSKRLETMRALSDAGIPVSVMTAPLIPALNDHEVERLLDSAKAFGAEQAGYVLLRLPHEVSPIFKDWLLKYYPEKYRHVMGLIRSMRGGKDYDADWQTRRRGTGPYAWQIGRRFELATKRLGLNRRSRMLRTDLFSVPNAHRTQLSLF